MLRKLKINNVMILLNILTIIKWLIIGQDITTNNFIFDFIILNMIYLVCLIAYNKAIEKDLFEDIEI